MFLRKPSKATPRAPGISAGVYYKAGNIPWRPRDLSSEACSWRIISSFEATSGDLIYASVAQAFSNNVEPFALKGPLFRASRAAINVLTSPKRRLRV